MAYALSLMCCSVCVAHGSQPEFITGSQCSRPGHGPSREKGTAPGLADSQSVLHRSLEGRLIGVQYLIDRVEIAVSAQLFP
jgi:hypothetical protein